MTTSSKRTTDYTMKIVLTMTVEAASREQAEVLASHVSAFLPEDAQRVADAFSPMIIVTSGDSESNPNGRKRSAATAAVVMVADGPQEATAPTDGAVLSVPNLSLPDAAAESRHSVSPLVRPTSGRQKTRRPSLYTQGSF